MGRRDWFWDPFVWEEIVPAVFAPCELRYWQQERRLIWRTAYVPHGDMNVAVGPSKDHFEKPLGVVTWSL